MELACGRRLLTLKLTCLGHSVHQLYLQSFAFFWSFLLPFKPAATAGGAMALQCGNHVSSRYLIQNGHLLLFAFWWQEGFVDLPSFSQFIYMIPELILRPGFMLGKSVPTPHPRQQLWLTFPPVPCACVRREAHLFHANLLRLLTEVITCTESTRRPFSGVCFSF